jgi:TonB family protein
MKKLILSIMLAGTICAARAGDNTSSVKNADPVLLSTPTYEYPTSAAMKRIEGTCKVTFDVTPTGFTENIHIKPEECITSDGKPTTLFFRTSTKAIQNFKFSPKIEDGKPVYAHNQTYTITYKMKK